MSAAGVAITVLAFLALGVPVTFAIMRDERAKRREWRPNGYRAGVDSTATVGDWWPRPLPAVGLRQTVRVIGTPPAAELVSVADPRLVRTSRHLGAPTNGVGSAPKRARAERARRIAKKRKAARSRGAA